MLDSFVDNGVQLIVTEMCESYLTNLILNRKKHDLPTAKKITKQIADAVAFMHRLWNLSSRFKARQHFIEKRGQYYSDG